VAVPVLAIMCLCARQDTRAAIDLIFCDAGGFLAINLDPVEILALNSCDLNDFLAVLRTPLPAPSRRLGSIGVCRIIKQNYQRQDYHHLCVGTVLACRYRLSLARSAGRAKRL